MDGDAAASLPEPLVPAEVSLRGLPGFILDIDRLLASELVALGSPEECWAAVMLWCRAWKQSPPASLPDDDRILAAYSGAGRRWPKVKAQALRGFRKCRDGRLYHPVLAAEALKAWRKRQSYAADQQRLKRWRAQRREDDGAAAEPPPEAVITPPFGNAAETGFETPSRAVVKAEVKVKVKEKEKSEGGSSAPPARGDAGLPDGAIAWSETGPGKAAPEGAHVAWSFHKMRENRFGRAPPRWISAEEIAIGERWIASGADYESCRQLMELRMRRMTQKGEGPPLTMRYFATMIDKGEG